MRNVDNWEEVMLYFSKIFINPETIFFFTIQSKKKYNINEEINALLVHWNIKNMLLFPSQNVVSSHHIKTQIWKFIQWIKIKY